METYKYFNLVVDELDKEGTFELANETTTSSTGISNLLGKIWLKELVLLGREKAYLLQGAKEVIVPKGNKDLDVPIESSILNPTVTTTEAATVTWTEITNLSTITVTPTPKRYAVSISSRAVMQSQVDLVNYAKRALVDGFTTDMEGAIASAVAGASSPAASLYGGDATSTSTLETGDTITPALIADAATELKKQKWVPEADRPFLLYVAPEQEGTLLKDSQFTNAAEYGGNEVLLNGEIGKYMGVKVLATPNVPAASDWGAGGNLAGHTCFAVKSKVAYVVGWQEDGKPKVDYEYFKADATHRIYLDVMYDVKTLQQKAIVLIYVTDA